MKDRLGANAPGWYPEAPSVRQLAQAPSKNHNGYGAFAQVLATILSSAAPAGINHYNPATSSYDPGIETQR
jgi:hypothetical protein